MSGTQITRRTLFAWTGALVAVGALASCTTGGSNGATTSPSAAGKLLGPKDAPYAGLYPSLPRGGAMSMGLLGASASGLVSLDLLTSTFTGTLWAVGPVHDYLEVYDESAVLKPSLAKKVSQDTPTKLTYTLRDNLMFHNGQKVTAQDVKDTFDFCRNPANKSVWLSQLLTVTNVEAPDATTVIFTTSQPSATLRNSISQIPVIPIATAKDQATKPVGCGPFAFDTWVQDSYVGFTKFDKYWNPDAPRVDSLKINLVADANAGLQSLQAGQLQCIFPAAVSSLQQIKTMEDSGQATSLVTPAAMQLAPNNKRAPFDNPDVRKAIRLAIDKTAIVKDVYFGLSDPLVTIGVDPQNYFYPKSLEFKRDVAAAKKLIAAAGLSGKTFKLLTANTDAYPATAAVIQQNLKAVGLNVEIETTDFATVVDRSFNKHDFDLSLIAVAMEQDPAGRIDRYVTTTGASNLAQYSNTEVDQLLTSAHSELDRAKRKQIYEKAIKIAFIDDTAIVPICIDSHIAVAPGKTKHLAQYGPKPNNQYHWPIVVNKA